MCCSANLKSSAKRSGRYAIMFVALFVAWYVFIVSESVGYLGAAVVLPYAFQYLIGGLILLAVIILIAVGAVEVMNRTRLGEGPRAAGPKPTGPTAHASR